MLQAPRPLAPGPGDAPTATAHAPVVLAAMACAFGGFALMAVALALPLPVPPALILGAAALAVAGAAALAGHARRQGRVVPLDALPVAALATAATFLLLMTLYHLAAYIRLPVDLLSFAESPFVTDIIKLRTGEPLYTPAADNNSYPYTPGTQILTYAISSVLGGGDDIAFLRTVQFGYVVLAALVATSICDMLARLLVGRAYRHAPVWRVVWFAVLLLVATEPRFNAYTHSLHNDGLALLISMSAYWLMTRWALERRSWILIAMAVLPAAGFLVKQNQLLWAGVFALYLLASGGMPLRRLALFVAGTTAFVAAAIAACYALWGDPFAYWIFAALGEKQVSVARSARHLLMAGTYYAMGLFAAWVLALRDRSRAAWLLLGAWALVFGMQTFTSGIGFAANHMGPGVVLAVCWFLVTVLKLWPHGAVGDRWRYAQAGAAAGAVLMLVAGLGVVREPVTELSDDFDRYVAEIEAEFADLPVESVLLDTGTWPYLKAGVLMRDRATPVSLHVGINQTEIGHANLAETIRRFRERRYARILAREIDTDQSRYDFQNRGSGVREAILENYHEVRRIRAVEGVQRWWPLHLLAEIVVLEPNETPFAPPPHE
ncbi:MAG TPA: hypothetical protein VFZ69_15965 [Longimicrobiales bacterium]